MGHQERTHSCMRLLQQISRLGSPDIVIPDELLTDARTLDLHYISSLCPNRVGRTPEEFYDERVSSELSTRARHIYDFAMNYIESLLGHVTLERVKKRMNAVEIARNYVNAKSSQIAEKLVKIGSVIQAKSIVLFGSRARGDFMAVSDVDVLFIVAGSSTRKEIFDLQLRIMENWNEELALEPIVLPAEKTRKALLRPFYWYILEEGKVLCDDGTFSEMLGCFHQLKARDLIERTNTGGWKFNYEGIEKFLHEYFGTNSRC